MFYGGFSKRKDKETTADPKDHILDHSVRRSARQDLLPVAQVEFAVPPPSQSEMVDGAAVPLAGGPPSYAITTLSGMFSEWSADDIAAVLATTGGDMDGAIDFICVAGTPSVFHEQRLVEQLTTVEVVSPAGVAPGSLISIDPFGSGFECYVRIPLGVQPGQSFLASVPRPIQRAIRSPAPPTLTAPINHLDAAKKTDLAFTVPLPPPSSSSSTVASRSEVVAALEAWDAPAHLLARRRQPLVDLVCGGRLPRSATLAAWARLSGAAKADTGGCGLRELVRRADGGPLPTTAATEAAMMTTLAARDADERAAALRREDGDAGVGGAVTASVRHHIRKDLHRTRVDNGVFENFDSGFLDPTVGPLYRVLVAYACLDKTVGYVQGMNFVAAFCVAVTSAHVMGVDRVGANAAGHTQSSVTAGPRRGSVWDDDYDDDDFGGAGPARQRGKAGAVLGAVNAEDEAAAQANSHARAIEGGGAPAAFLLFVRLMQGTSLRRVFDKTDNHIHALIQRLDWHLLHVAPLLSAHLEEQGVPSVMFAVEWLTTLFVYNLPFDTCRVVLGLYLVEGGMDFIVQCGVALLAHLEPELLACAFDTLVPTLKRKLATLTPSELLTALRLLPHRARAANNDADYTLPDTASGKVATAHAQVAYPAAAPAPAPGKQTKPLGPTSAAAAFSAASPTHELVRVVVPRFLNPNEPARLALPDGRFAEVSFPAGAKAGQSVEIRVPALALQPLLQPPPQPAASSLAAGAIVGGSAVLSAQAAHWWLVTKRPRWMAVSEVLSCSTPTCRKPTFSTLTARVRRYHCRACGEVICQSCSGRRAPLPQLGYHGDGGKGVRVCDRCVAGNSALVPGACGWYQQQMHVVRAETAAAGLVDKAKTAHPPRCFAFVCDAPVRSINDLVVAGGGTPLPVPLPTVPRRPVSALALSSAPVLAPHDGQAGIMSSRPSTGQLLAEKEPEATRTVSPVSSTVGSLPSSSLASSTAGSPWRSEDGLVDYDPALVLTAALAAVLGLGRSSSEFAAHEAVARRVTAGSDSLEASDYSASASAFVTLSAALAEQAPLRDSISRQSSSGDKAKPVPVVEVVEVAPAAFRAIRLSFGHRLRAFAAALGGKPLLAVGKGSGGGRSGADFFLSADRTLIVKAMSKDEVEVLLRLLPSYADHVLAHVGTTLLPRFLALVRLVLPAKGVRMPRAFVVMPNLLHLNQPGVAIKQIFDLKGSLHSRYVKPQELDAVAAAEPISPGSPDGNDFDVGAPSMRRDALFDFGFLTMPAASGQQPAASPQPRVLKDLNFCPHHGERRPNAQPAQSAVSTSTRLLASHASFAESGGEVLGHIASSISGALSPSVPGKSLTGLHLRARLAEAIKPTDKAAASSGPGAMAPLHGLPSAAPLLPARGLADDDISDLLEASSVSDGCSDGDARSSVSSVAGSSVSSVGAARGGVPRCRCLRLGPERRAVLLANARNDVGWLRGHGLMDYSLLVGVGTCKASAVQAERNARHATLRAHALRTAAHRGGGDSTAGDDDDDGWSEPTLLYWSRELGGVCASDALSDSTHSEAKAVRHSVHHLTAVLPDSDDDDDDDDNDDDESVVDGRIESGDVLGRQGEGKGEAGGAASALDDHDGCNDDDEREWYTLGIIDILQEFNARKQAEGFVKAKVLGKEEVSAVHPGLYAGRFVAFLEKHTE